MLTTRSIRSSIAVAFLVCGFAAPAYPQEGYDPASIRLRETLKRIQKEREDAANPVLQARRRAKAEKASIESRCKKLGGVNIGMDSASVLKSCWGKPARINETVTARGRHEQWVYGGGYLYLDNGVVSSIQTSR